MSLIEYDAESKNYINKEIIIENRAEAVAVIDGLAKQITTRGVATVADLYALIGETGHFYDQHWGWTASLLATADVREGPIGFLLDLPDPEPLGR